MKIYQTTHEAYLATLQDVYFNYEYKASPRGLPIREKTDYMFRVLNPASESIITKDLERNKVIADYTHKEMELYNSCSNRVEDFAKASKFWEKLQNPDGTINSAYGYLIWKNKSHGKPEWDMYQFKEGDQVVVADGVWDEWELAHRHSIGFGYLLKGTVIKTHKNPGSDEVYYTIRESGLDGTFREDQLVREFPEQQLQPKIRTPWEYCVQALRADKDTRQAILRFSLPEHFWVGNKDMTCTLNGNFLIRDDKLHLSVVMRSGDMVKGAVYDWVWFCSLMDKMVEELRPNYPNLTKGHYTHMTHSLHIYEKDEKVVRKMLGM